MRPRPRYSYATDYIGYTGARSFDKWRSAIGFNVVYREAELLECIQDMVHQFACLDDKGRLDSMSIGALADAMRILAASGRLEIEHEHGRRVIGRATNHSFGCTP